MLEFLSVLFNTFQQANVHTAIFINGALEPDRWAMLFSLGSRLKERRLKILQKYTVQWGK